MQMTNRRAFLISTAAIAVTGAAGFGLQRGGAAASEESFEITRSEAEWRETLTEQQFAVLREEGTERAFTSPLLEEKRAGTYNCAGCDLPVYDAATKFESGTGWPSFWQAIEGSVGTKQDRSFFMTRTEVHCSRCGGHLGHIFDDGPPPTGKRHCINGVALTFEPASAA